MLTAEEIAVIRKACGLRTEGSEAHALLDRLETEPTVGPVRVVLHAPGPGDGEEVVLGPFNQGVVMERKDPTAPLSIYNVADGGAAIARSFPNLEWMIEGDEANRTFASAFVQAVSG